MNSKQEHNHSNNRIIAVYVTFCLIVLLASSVVMTDYVKRSMTNQIGYILGLMSEKVDTSFGMMTNYITEASDLLSAKSDMSWEESYNELLSTVENMPYTGIGLIDAKGRIYGMPGEIMDVEKHGFWDDIKNREDIYITEPYRSSVTGTNMILMFAPIYKNSALSGHIYMVFYLETIQNLAHTDILSEKMQISLMNPYSGNFVTCTADEDTPSGTWSNIRLVKNDISPLYGYNMNDWLESMRSGGSNNILNYIYDGVSYTQAYVSIDKMENWNIIIRLPIGELSNTMQTFTLGISISAVLLILATLLFCAVLYIKEYRRSKTLKKLSDIDGLTKTMNHRAFETFADDLFSDDTKLGRTTFIYLDIDRFKSYNDNYGHAAGDKVLHDAAEIMSDAFGESAVVGRVGGDEFNILVYEPLDMMHIDSIMANVRMRFAEMKLEDGTPMDVTYSAGLAVYPQDAKDLKTLKECADKALYHVKENGRNNHFWYSDIRKK